MREAVNKISIVYYLIYTATIILTVIGFFTNLSSIGFELPELAVQNVVTIGIISYVSIALVLAFALFEINKIILKFCMYINIYNIFYKYI